MKEAMVTQGLPSGYQRACNSGFKSWAPRPEPSGLVMKVMTNEGKRHRRVPRVTSVGLPQLIDVCDYEKGHVNRGAIAPADS